MYMKFRIHLIFEAHHGSPENSTFRPRSCWWIPSWEPDGGSVARPATRPFLAPVPTLHCFNYWRISTHLNHLTTCIINNDDMYIYIYHLWHFKTDTATTKLWHSSRWHCLNTAIADGTLMDRRDTLFSWRIIPFSKDPLINGIYIYNLTSWVIKYIYIYIINW